MNFAVACLSRRSGALHALSPAVPLPRPKKTMTSRMWLPSLRKSSTLRKLSPAIGLSSYCTKASLPSSKSRSIVKDRVRSLLGQHLLKAIYSLTEQGIALLPILAQMGAWGVRFLPVSEELGVRAQLLADGGTDMWNAFMDELRERHLARSAHVKKKAALSVSGQLQRALETAQARPHKKRIKVRGFDKSRPRAR